MMPIRRMMPRVRARARRLLRRMFLFQSDIEQDYNDFRSDALPAYFEARCAFSQLSIVRLASLLLSQLNEPRQQAFRRSVSPQPRLIFLWPCYGGCGLASSSSSHCGFFAVRAAFCYGRYCRPSLVAANVAYFSLS